MHYDTFEQNPNLNAVVKCHWILEVPADLEAPKQRIVPDGCIEMCFILGDDVRRYTSEEEFIIQPRAMVIGQITKPYFIQPVGYVNTFAVRFYPFGFANFISTSISELADKETPLEDLFDPKEVKQLVDQIIKAATTEARIAAVESFLLNKLHETTVIENIVSKTVDAISRTGGNVSINELLQENPSQRRSLERKFAKEVGISPKHLGRIIRLQAALQLMLHKKGEKLTQIAYESNYYDQAHFIKDFKDFTGINPKEYLTNDQMMLSSLINSKE